MARPEEIEFENLKNEALELIGSRIQILRETKKLSQVDLAGLVVGKIDTTNISRIESGRTNITFSTLYRISKALEVPLEDIVKGIK